MIIDKNTALKWLHEFDALMIGILIDSEDHWDDHWADAVRTALNDLIKVIEEEWEE